MRFTITTLTILIVDTRKSIRRDRINCRQTKCKAHYKPTGHPVLSARCNAFRFIHYLFAPHLHCTSDYKSPNTQLNAENHMNGANVWIVGTYDSVNNKKNWAMKNWFTVLVYAQELDEKKNYVSWDEKIVQNRKIWFMIFRRPSHGFKLYLDRHNAICVKA